MFCFLIFGINTTWICGHASAWFYALLPHDFLIGWMHEETAVQAFLTKCSVSVCPFTRLLVSLLLSVSQWERKRETARKKESCNLAGWLRKWDLLGCVWLWQSEWMETLVRVFVWTWGWRSVLGEFYSPCQIQDSTKCFLSTILHLFFSLSSLCVEERVSPVCVVTAKREMCNR